VWAQQRAHNDPTWIVEAMTRAATGTAEGHEAVRGEPCGRYSFAVDLARDGAGLELPPHRGRVAPRLSGSVWIDPEGRIRRVTWTQVHARRPRSIRRRRTRVRLWRTVELWEFAIPVDIGVPVALPASPKPWPLELVALWWRARRRSGAT
jgi:hypothetical protein